jgi:hypothetical protein
MDDKENRVVRIEPLKAMAVRLINVFLNVASCNWVGIVEVAAFWENQANYAASRSQTVVIFSSWSHRPHRSYIVLLPGQCDYITCHGHVNERGCVRSLDSHRSRFWETGIFKKSSISRYHFLRVSADIITKIHKIVLRDS